MLGLFKKEIKNIKEVEEQKERYFKTVLNIIDYDNNIEKFTLRANAFDYTCTHSGNMLLVHIYGKQWQNYTEVFNLSKIKRYYFTVAEEITEEEYYDIY